MYCDRPGPNQTATNKFYELHSLTHALRRRVIRKTFMSSTQGVEIVIAEDSRIQAKILERRLTEAGHRVRWAQMDRPLWTLSVSGLQQLLSQTSKCQR